jgi:hypothetical protein
MTERFDSLAPPLYVSRQRRKKTWEESFSYQSYQ